MNKIIFSAVCLLFAFQSCAAEITDPAATPDNETSRIAQYTQKTAENTKLGWFDGFLMGFTIVSAVFAGLSAYYAHMTARNVVRREIKEQFQEEIFKDLIRHLYRNKVCVCAMRWKLENRGFGAYYPSEEHLLKLKVLPEDLRLDRFDNMPEHYGELHRMELLFRNYNIEVDVALEHLKMKNLPKKDKIRDLEYTLEFKSQMLTKNIMGLMNGLGMTIDDAGVRAMLIEKAKKDAENYQKPYKPDQVPERTKADEGMPDRYRYYDDDLDIAAVLSEAISHEYDKINLIRF